MQYIPRHARENPPPFQRWSQLACAILLLCGNTIQETRDYYRTAASDVAEKLGPIAADLALHNYGADIFATDNHCNIYGPLILAAIEDIMNSRAVFLAGDTTTNGTEFEEYCVRAITDRLPPDTSIIAVIGNHDGTDTVKQLIKQGVTVLDGYVTLPDGTLVYGRSDPQRTNPLSSTTLRDPTTSIDSFRQQVTKDMQRNPADILLLHNTYGLDPDGVSTMLSGHSHGQHLGHNPGDKLRLVGDDAVGADKSPQTVFGKYTSPSSRYLLIFDRKNPKKYIAMIQIIVYPNGQVELKQTWF